jgi:two-component system chemotaxis sensor kinase CheA
MDMSQYRDLFVSEARRHLETFNSLLVQLEHSPDREVIHEIFRHAHSLKGMAAIMQFDGIADLAHSLEDLMAKVRDGTFSLDPGLTDILLEGSDLLGSMVTVVEADDGSEFPDASDLIRRIMDFTPGQGEAIRPASGKTEQPPSPPPQHQFRQSDSFTTVRVKTETLDRLVTITGELITTRHHLAEQCSSAASSGMAEPLRQLALQLRELRDEVFQARMLPFSVVAERFPRLVRDLAREREKEVRLRIDGGEIELDRGILEAITEPLVHLLRNAVDHGLELPDERATTGKERSGLITLSVTRKKDQVCIMVADDGRGMDPARLKDRALERGVITPDQAATMSAEEALTLIWTPGFSTAETVTGVSGRGVGMDAVRSAVRTLGGTLSMQSSVGRGSRFRLTLPLTVSIIQALLVESGPLTVALPVNAVERTLELTRDEIVEQDGGRFCSSAGIRMPLLNLHQLLGRTPPPAASRYIPVVVITVNGRRMGLMVDAITGQHEIFVKPLGKPFSHLKNSNGGAILGDGRIVFVMDANTFA